MVPRPPHDKPTARFEVQVRGCPKKIFAKQTAAGIIASPTRRGGSPKASKLMAIASHTAIQKIKLAIRIYSGVRVGARIRVATMALAIGGNGPVNRG